MNILYIHQYFKTPSEGGSIRSYYLAKGLADAGHEVTMITTHPFHREVKMVDGIRVHYLSVNYNNTFGFLKRIYSFLRFVYLARKEAKKLPKADLAYVMTTPLSTGFIATYLKKRLDTPYYFEVGDLWPQAPVEMGVITNFWLKKWLYKMEATFYFEADKIIALSPAIRDRIEKTAPNKEVYVIPNMADCDFFQANFSEGNPTPSRPFRVTYFGAIGRANHLEFFLNVAKASLSAELPIRFNVLGEGSERKRLEQTVGKLPNVTFHSFADKRRVKAFLDRSDASYVSFKDIPVLNTGSPNKFFDSLALGKLVIINFEGWIKDVIEKNKCGFYHDPHAPEEFIRKIKVFLTSRNLLIQYQRNGRTLAERHYDRKMQVAKLLKILDNEYTFERADSEVSDPARPLTE